LSPIIANLVLQDLEDKERINRCIPFYFRYVDDILLSAPLDIKIKIISDIKRYGLKIHKRIHT